jgi:trimethylamine-N-oxide reductase cytochrome c-type subunit TorC
MGENVGAEYQETVHFANASGVRAGCADCHVPRPWFQKVARKVAATGELWGHFTGVIDTPEKFEAHRATMAKRVWANMEENDSQTCRNCHSYDAMDFHAQRTAASEAMMVAMQNGDTCIDCHKGVAHQMPDLSTGYKTMFKDLRVQSQKEGARDDLLYNISEKPIFMEASLVGTDDDGGKLISATELQVLERQGDAVRVRVDGWRQDGVDRVIYALMGQRIFSVAMSKSVTDRVEVHESHYDEDTELTWHKVSMDFWVSKDDLIANRASLWDYGSEMYNASCSTCHTLSGPGHFLANQWIGQLKAMERFVSLDKEQYRFLQKYLQFHAKDVAGDPHADG